MEIMMCVCVCVSVSRKKISSQQQRWGSEEEKMAGNSHAPTVQNTYTALALNDSSDLPPSPMSPMTSAMGIDPKWEFPRENIDLQDELAVGQFTVLYKGVAKGLKDNRSCNVAVKSLRGVYVCACVVVDVGNWGIKRNWKRVVLNYIPVNVHYIMLQINHIASQGNSIKL